ncbi:MAG: ankyrin repeat protein [Cyclobacteriaceae bacterium]|jgi:ankyrin repeat protein
MKNQLITSILLMSIICLSAYAKPQDDFWKATKQCDLEGVKKAISKGADPKALDAYGQTSFSSAIFCPEITKYFIELGVDPNSDGGNALISAGSTYSIEVMKLLLDAGADPNSRSSIFGPLWTDDGKSSAVEIVIRQTNCVPCLEMLKEAGADFGYMFQNNKNLVYLLAFWSMTKEQRKSLYTQSKPIMENFGFKVPDWYGNLGDDRNGTAEQMLDILIDAGCDINLQSTMNEIKVKRKKAVESDKIWQSYTPLMEAIGYLEGSSNAKQHMALLLLKKGAGVSVKTEFFNQTAITLAASTDNPQLVKMIIDAGANLEDEVTTVDQTLNIYLKGATPLVLAAKYNRLENCKILLDAGAKITNGAQGVGTSDKGCFYQIKDKSGLYFAIETGNIELVDLFTDNFKFWNNNLLQYIQPDQTTESDWGAYVSVDKTCSKTKGGLRPSMYASELGNKALAKHLMKKGL